MKLHSLICLFLLISSLSLKAEEPNIWDDFLSLFSSGDNQGEECDETKTAEHIAQDIRLKVCPHFLMRQMINRDRSIMLTSWDISPDESCGSVEQLDSHFKNNQEFENYLKNKEPFSEINTTSIADCLNHSFPVKINKKRTTTHEKTLPEKNHKALIAEYYSTQYRLESGLKNTFHDITAIDQFIGKPILNGIDCKEFESISDISNECASLQKCSAPPANLSQPAKDTIEAMRAIAAIDQQIDTLDGNFFNDDAKKNKDKIQELKERKAALQSLYPWTAGKIFNKKYKENASEEQVAQWIKEQLSYTRTRLEKNLNEMTQAVSCLRHNQECEKLEFDKVMAKTPPIDNESIFQTKSISSMSSSELAALSPEQRQNLAKNTIADTHFANTQCRQKIREDVTDANAQLGFLILDTGLTVATVGLGSAAIAGRLAVRASTSISKAQRLQNIGLMGIDIAFSAPHINRAIDYCEDTMSQLERTSNEKQVSNVCDSMSVRSKLTSDLKSCLLVASLSSLPLVIPGFALAGRAVAKKMGAVKGEPPSSPPPPKPASYRDFSKPNNKALPKIPKGGTPNQSTAASSQAKQRPSPKQSATASNQVKPRSSSETNRQAIVKTKSSGTNILSRNNNISSRTREVQKPSTNVQTLPSLKSPSGRTAKGEASRQNVEVKRTGKSSAERSAQTRRREAQKRQREKIRPKRNTQERNSAARANPSQRASNRFGSLKDSENRAGKLSKRILQMIQKNNIVNRKGKNSIGDYLLQARTHLKQQNPRLNDDRISQTIAQELRQQGAKVKYSKGNFRIETNEGIFIVNPQGKMSRTSRTQTAHTSPRTSTPARAQTAGASTTPARNQNVQTYTKAKNTATGSRALVEKPNTNLKNQAAQKPTNRQNIASTGARAARSANNTLPSPPRPDRLVPRSIRAGIAAKNIAAGAIAVPPSIAEAPTGEDSENDNKDSQDDNTENNSNSKTEISNSNRDDDRSDDRNDEEDKDKKKDNWDCSKYKGKSPKNRKEMICYYYARAAQLSEEIKNIQQTTQALNNFKNQVWMGIKENQVPPGFFNSALQQHVTQNKNATTDYLSSFRLMYDISRIQNQYLNPNDTFRLKQIIQETDQYMRSASLDGYSHIQESINILLNRLQVRGNNPFIQ